MKVFYVSCNYFNVLLEYPQLQQYAAKRDTSMKLKAK